MKGWPNACLCRPSPGNVLCTFLIDLAVVGGTRSRFALGAHEGVHSTEFKASGESQSRDFALSWEHEVTFF